MARISTDSLEGFAEFSTWYEVVNLGQERCTAPQAMRFAGKCTSFCRRQALLRLVENVVPEHCLQRRDTTSYCLLASATHWIKRASSLM